MTRAQPLSVAWQGDESRETIQQAYLTPHEAEVLDNIWRRAVRSTDQAVALRVPDGRILSILVNPASFALLQRIAAIAAQPDVYAAMQQQAHLLRERKDESRYVDMRHVLGE